MKDDYTQRYEQPGSFALHNRDRGTFGAPLLRQARILVVDDEPVGAGLRGEVLEEHGYLVTLYYRPLDVLNCDVSKYDLAIVDFYMPELNGRELLLRMRASGAQFPIVLLTGCVDALSKEDRVLFARCIDKAEPITFLLDSIAEFLDPNQTPDFDAGGHSM